MYLGEELPHIETVPLQWTPQRYRMFSIAPNQHRKKIKITWLQAFPDIRFRIYFGRKARDPGDNKESLCFTVTETSKFSFPFVIYEDSGPDCYKGSINFRMIEEYYSGSTSFHIIEY